MSLKPGYLTTEFWLTVAVNVGALLAAIADKLPSRYAALAATISAGLYAVARGWAKSSPALKPPPAPPAPPAA